MEIPPPRSETVAGSAIPGLSPSESVILFGDRLAPTHDKPGYSDVRLPLSGRYTPLDGFAFDVLCSALGALEAAGELELTIRPHKGLLGSDELVAVRQLRAPHEWPLKSPEARIGAWLYTQPGNEAWLEDLIIHSMIPAVTNTPHRSAFEYLVAGLLERGVLEVVRRRAYVFFRISEYQVVEPWSATLARVRQRDVDESLLCFKLLGSDIRLKCLESWDRGTRHRSDVGTAPV